MGQVLFLECGILEITHHGIKLCHGVAYGSTRCEDNTTTTGDFIQIAALHKHIGRFLRFRGGKSGNIPHFCIQKEVFERMTLIHKQAVNTQLLKGYNIILAVVCQQFIQTGLQGFPCLFHLFDGETFTALLFQFSNGTFNLVNLFP